jgi:hypothetical protein
VLRELEPLAEQTNDLDVFQAIRAVVDRHGGGPYPADENVHGVARPRVGEQPVHRQLLAHCQPLDGTQGAPSIPAQRKARREYENRVNALPADTP